MSQWYRSDPYSEEALRVSVARATELAQELSKQTLRFLMELDEATKAGFTAQHVELLTVPPPSPTRGWKLEISEQNHEVIPRLMDSLVEHMERLDAELRELRTLDYKLKREKERQANPDRVYVFKP